MTTKTKIKIKKGFTLSGDEVNSMLDAVNDYAGNKEIKITQKMIDESAEFSDDGEIPQELLGYKVKRKKVGEHKHDGQLVEYIFTFTSPDGKKTVIETEMCLMIGWNLFDDVTFK